LYHYHPTRQPLLVRENELRIMRRLPVQGNVSVRPGDRVEPGAIVATAEHANAPFLINVAHELDMDPAAVPERLTKDPGQAIAANEPIAKRRRGLRTTSVRSPVAGTFIGFDTITGTAAIRPHATRVELAAYVSGVIEDVETAWGVTIRTFGSRFYGTFGLGDETFGVLKVVGGDRQRPLSPDLIDGRASRAVIAAGGTASAAALAKAVQVGARGVIVGSIEENELTSFLRVPEGTLWRVGLPDWKLPFASSPITIVITEGFGRAAMAAPFYETLAANDGAEISLCGLTRLAGGLSRPEVLLPSRAGMRGGDESSLPVASLSPGATVRLVDQDHLGVIATVREAPRFRRFDGDVLLDALVIDLPNGEPMLVPTANVEVLS
jgi:hypothetical protein